MSDSEEIEDEVTDYTIDVKVYRHTINKKGTLLIETTLHFMSIEDVIKFCDKGGIHFK